MSCSAVHLPPSVDLRVILLQHGNPNIESKLLKDLEIIGKCVLFRNLLWIDRFRSLASRTPVLKEVGIGRYHRPGGQHGRWSRRTLESSSLGSYKLATAGSNFRCSTAHAPPTDQ